MPTKTHSWTVQLTLFLLLLFLNLTAVSYANSIITVEAGSNIQQIVKNAPEGAMLKFGPGVYRMQRVKPKHDQQFIGEPGVIFNGAAVLADWQQEDDVWFATVPERRLPLTGFCFRGGDYCKHREDLFVDNILHRRSESLDDLRDSGPDGRKWYDGGDRLYLSDDPTDKIVELGLVPYAFVSDASNVVLKNITVEKYASASQRGAIEFLKGTNWQLINVVARWNHGAGARIGPGTRIKGGAYSHNGQLGIGGGFGKGIIVDGAEIAHNNYAAYSASWEAGGTKFVKTDGMVVRNNCVHHNNGPGLWTDIDNINATYTLNKVFNNTGDGIKHEISYKAIIRKNVVANNGSAKDAWLWGSQILVQNSGNVEVVENTVQVAAKYGNGISIIQQDRGDGGYGPYVSVNNRIHDNRIIFLSKHGNMGMVADYDRDAFTNDGNNIFDNNTYIVAKKSKRYLEIVGKFPTWAELRTMGIETNGTVQVKRSTPLRLSCAR